MAAWTVTAEKAQGQLAVRVTGPAAGPATYQARLLLTSQGVELAAGSVSAANAAAALPLAVAWAQGTLESWKTGLGAA